MHMTMPGVSIDFNTDINNIRANAFFNLNGDLLTFKSPSIINRISISDISGRMICEALSQNKRILMKEVKMFMFEGCPHCQKAQELIEALKGRYIEYAQINISVVDEKKDPITADAYDYYYVPALFVDELKSMKAYPVRIKLNQF